MQFTPTQEQQDILTAFKEHKVMKVNAVAGSGKEQPVSTPTPTPFGIVPFGSLKVGDYVIGSNGKPTTITAVFPQGVKDVYEVTFRDGSKVRCGLEHNWAVTSIGMRNHRKTVTLTTAELLEKGVVNKHGNMRFKVPLTSAVEFEAKDLTLHPYILGVFLGNGSLRVVAGQYTTTLLSLHKDNIEVYEKVKKLFEDTLQLVLKGTSRFTSENGIQVNLTTASDNSVNPVTQLFKNLGVSSANKHIPEIYLQGSIDQRLQLLQGLMDTDGCITKGRVSFSNTNKNLIEAVKYLVQSLGGTAILCKPDMRNSVVCYTLNVKMPLNPFSLTRKASQWKLSWKNPPSRYIIKIEKLGFQEEQMCITVDAEDSLYLTNDFVVTHNTSTVKMLAEQNNQPSLYVCYNKTTATEASNKFPKHTSCRTAHSLAYSLYGSILQHKLNRIKGTGYINAAKTVSEVVKYYKLEDIIPREGISVTARTQGTLIKDTVSRFQNSSDDTITEKHIPYKQLKEVLDTHPQVDESSLKEKIVRYANMLWCDRINPNSVVLAEHDTYLKLWQLSKPQLPYDIIYVDESQDSNPVILDVLRQQHHCKIVYVGDHFQSIYQWRQAVNAMQEIEAPTKLLSQSFRFGNSIAELATYIIDGKIHIKGNPSIDSKLGLFDSKTYTMIFRTNASLIDQAVRLISNGKKIKCEIDTTKFESVLTSVEALFKNDLKNVKDEDISLYGTWKDLLEALEEHVEYKRIVNIVLGNQTQRYLKAIHKMKKQSNDFDILLITAHKSKGLEWNNVIIGDDFPIDTILKLPHEKGYNQQEINLFYVACTRAKLNLQLPTEFEQVFNEALNDYEEEELDD